MPDPSPPRRSRGFLRDRRWLGLLASIALIAAAVVVARPGAEGDGTRFGPVDQVRPAATDAAELATAPEPGKLAPNFLLEGLDGQPIRLSDLRGRPVFLNFWATWCPFCVAEMPAMQKLADRYGDRLVVVGVNVGESVDTAHRFAEREGIRYLLLLDPNTQVTKAYQVRAMPTSVFIDADGVVRSVYYGPLIPPEMEERVAPLVSSVP